MVQPMSHGNSGTSLSSPEPQPAHASHRDDPPPTFPQGAGFNQLMNVEVLQK